MKYDPDIHHRRSIRLRGYDYSQAGFYFVTLCTTGARGKPLVGAVREPPQHVTPIRFGEIAGGEMHLNEYGEIVALCWRWLPKRYKFVRLDEWVVMPNHFHGIISITEAEGDSRIAPTKGLGRLIGVFKTVSTKRINEIRDTPGTAVWQRNYYERIIRNAAELDKIREYVTTNPLCWADDPENPDILPPSS